MMAENLLIAVLGGGNAILFIKFLIERYDRKHEREEDKETEAIKSALKKMEKDVLRTQLLLLILLKPEEKQEILTIAEHYFKDLKGNWYMTSIFNKWLTGAGEAKPEWFDIKE